VLSLPTPYDGSSRLFQIGLKPLDPANWLEPDQARNAQLAEKQRLFAECPEAVFGAMTGSEAAQAELLALVEAHSGHRAFERAEPPLLAAARLVQDDLILLDRTDAGWRVMAGALCFPSSWSLAEKLGQVMHDVHGPVPGFGQGTRPAQLIERMFDNLRPETPMIRWNWSLYGDDRLFHPDTLGPEERRFGTGERADPVFLRVERQTLRKLPQTGAIVFTIRISLDPLEALAAHPEAGRIATSLIGQIETLDPAQLDYKGLTLERQRLLARLAELQGLSL
jgi:hypothetical protein